MNDYILLNNKRYRTLQKDWSPKVIIPSTVNFNLDGTLDATFGPATVYVFSGSILIPVAASGEEWGTLDDFEALIASRSVITLVDHNNIQYKVVCGGFTKQSLSPKWDAESNWLFYIVQFIGRRV